MGDTEPVIVAAGNLGDDQCGVIDAPGQIETADASHLQAKVSLMSSPQARMTAPASELAGGFAAIE